MKKLLLLIMAVVMVGCGKNETQRLDKENSRVEEENSQVEGQDWTKEEQEWIKEGQAGIKREYDGIYKKIDSDQYKKMMTNLFEGKTKKELVAIFGKPHRVFEFAGSSYYYRIEIEDPNSGEKYHGVIFRFSQAKGSGINVLPPVVKYVSIDEDNVED